jgi:hypothetical protein
VFYQVPPPRPDKVEQEKQQQPQQMDAEDNMQTVSTGFRLPALNDKIKKETLMSTGTRAPSSGNAGSTESS